MTKSLTPQEILALPIEDPEYTDAKNVGQYLMKVLSEYYATNNSFNVGAPLGVRSWKVPLRDAFRKAGLINTEDYDTDSTMAGVFELLHNADWKKVIEYKEPEDWYVILLDTIDNGSPVMSDAFSVGFTEKAAKDKAANRNLGLKAGVWVAIQIPQ